MSFQIFNAPAHNMKDIVDDNGNINVPYMSMEDMAKTMGMSVDDLKEMIDSTPQRLDSLMKRFIENDDIRKALRGQ